MKLRRNLDEIYKPTDLSFENVRKLPPRAATELYLASINNEINSFCRFGALAGPSVAQRSDGCNMSGSTKLLHIAYIEARSILPTRV